MAKNQTPTDLAADAASEMGSPETEVIELPVGLWNAMASIIMEMPAPAFGNVPGAAVAKLINDIAAAKSR